MGGWVWWGGRSDVSGVGGGWVGAGRWVDGWMDG